MRYLPISRVKEHSILATPIFNEKGDILLNANVVLKRSYLNRLARMGYSGLYIYDEISKDIELQELLPEEMRIEAVKSLKTLNLDACRVLAHSIVDELLKQSSISVDMISVASFDTATYIHSINVAVLSVIIGIGSGMGNGQLKLLSEAALLHDIGKLSVNLEILNKKGTLTEEEMMIMRSHPMEGYNMVKDNYNISTVVKNAILSHHENEDGTGYPRNLKGDDIHYFAKIIHVCDVYDALIANRVYREALNPAEAIEYLMSHCWTLFDCTYVKKLMEYVSPYPTGITIELSNGQKAIVIQQNDQNRIRPKVRVIETKQEIDLMVILNLTIVKCLT